MPDTRPEPTPPDGIVRVAHLSDLHLPLQGPVPLRALLNKRILGYFNLRYLRSKTHTLAAARALLTHLVHRRPDLVVLTGDLVSLALPEEFSLVDRILREAGLSPENTLIVPGNHDRYTRRSDRTGAFERGMAAWLPPDFDRRDGYPLVRRLDPLTVLGLDTAVWRGPIRAAGYLGPAQVQRLEEKLPRGKTDPVLIAMHHPPWRLDGPWAKHHRAGLAGRSRLEPIFQSRRAVVVHGHLHELDHRRLGRSLSFGVASASNEESGRLRRLAWNEFLFSSSGLVSATTHQALAVAPGELLRFEARPLWPIPAEAPRTGSG